jgi:Fe-S-cluster containining protein
MNSIASEPLEIAGASQLPRATPPAFQCSSCGHCCNTWKVPIEAEKATHLLKQPWVQTRLSAFNAFFEPLSVWGYFVPHKPNLECLFWDDTHQCLIHHHEGASAKPTDCQRFPFSRLPATHLPEEGEPPHTRFSVSAACSQVARHYLYLPAHTPVQPGPLEQQAAHHVVHHPGPFYPDLPRQQTHYTRWPWPVQRFSPLSISEFQEILQQVAPLFDRGTETEEHFVSQLKIQCSPWQALKATEHALLNTIQETSPTNHSAEHALLQAVVQYPAQPTAWWVQHQLGLWLRTEYGHYPRWNWRLFGHYQDPKLFGQATLHRRDIKAMSWDETQRTLSMKAFLYHLLRRESALAYGTSLWHHVQLAKLGYILMEFYARAFAVYDAAHEVEACHTELAIRCVERYYTAHQPRVLARLEASPWLILGG